LPITGKCILFAENKTDSKTTVNICQAALSTHNMQLANCMPAAIRVIKYFLSYEVNNNNKKT